MNIFYTPFKTEKSLISMLKAAPQRAVSQLIDDAGHCATATHTIENIHFDWSKTAFSTSMLAAFIDYATQANFPERIKAIHAGAVANSTEQRPVLHMRLRDPQSYAEIAQQWQKMQDLEKLIQARDDIHAVINIGIGGSDLGPRMLCHALQPFQRDRGKRFFFLSNCDGSEIDQILAQIEPQKTALIVSSKSFATPETLANLKALQERANMPFALKVAVTAQAEKAMAHGFAPDHIFSMWDWVGGRFSLWSAIGLPSLLQIGTAQFSEFLRGGRMIDDHVLSAPLAQNIPFLMAGLGVFHRNICDYPALAILPYTSRLEHLSSYLQQLEMESNGKAVTIDGAQVEGATCPVIFGQVGTNGQHAFHQLLHQGTECIPADFITFGQLPNSTAEMDKMLLTNAMAQAEALARGQDNKAEPHRHFAGNRPSSHLHFSKFSPFALGQLIALYEYKTIYQGLFWGINSFDQWGVELGKTIALQLDDKTEKENFSLSTQNFMNHINF